VRWVVISLALHAAIIVWLARDPRSEHLVAWTPPVLPAYERVDMATTIELVDEPAVAGGGGTAASRTAHVPMRSQDAWEQITVRVERDVPDAAADGTETHGDDRRGHGVGVGGGHGNGIGFGGGGGVRVADDVPRPPPPPPVSKARPAKLVWPTRDEAVDDDANLFVARITVDDQGSVIAARMLTMRPGAKADHAANAIWTFRYAPALDDDGRPIKSTFEQPFQVR
jgi:hypothetical protein